MLKMHTPRRLRIVLIFGAVAFIFFGVGRYYYGISAQMVAFGLVFTLVGGLLLNWRWSGIVVGASEDVPKEILIALQDLIFSDHGFHFDPRGGLSSRESIRHFLSATATHIAIRLPILSMPGLKTAYLFSTRNMSALLAKNYVRHSNLHMMDFEFAGRFTGPCQGTLILASFGRPLDPVCAYQVDLIQQRTSAQMTVAVALLIPFIAAGIASILGVSRETLWHFTIFFSGLSLILSIIAATRFMGYRRRRATSQKWGLTKHWAFEREGGCLARLSSSGLSAEEEKVFLQKLDGFANECGWDRIGTYSANGQILLAIHRPSTVVSEVLARVGDRFSLRA